MRTKVGYTTPAVNACSIGGPGLPGDILLLHGASTPVSFDGDQRTMSKTPRMEILEYCDTPIGKLCLRRRELLSKPGTIITEVTLDNEFLMSSYHTASERALASLAIEWHGGSGLHVLIGGLGLGYTAHAALEFTSVEEVEVLELLPQVISWLSRDLVPLGGVLKDDPRLRISLLHFDIDFNRPTLTGLQNLCSTVVRGGVVIFCEYGVLEWGGESNAVEECLGDQGYAIQKFDWNNTHGGFLIRSEHRSTGTRSWY